MNRKKGPAAMGVAGPGGIREQTQHIDPHDTGKGWPWCELHHRPLIDELPARCPLRASNAHDAIFNLTDAAYHEIGKYPNPCDLTGALAALRRADVCYECIGRQLANPQVKRLRAKARRGAA